MFPRPDPKPDSSIPPPENAQDDVKKWTLMFYFASDNSLASAIVSQLKAIKEAGFHKDVNVVARYDPHDGTTPTHIFDVNYGEKTLSTKEHFIGFNCGDPYVRPLVGDKLWSDEKDQKGNEIRQTIVDWFADLGKLDSGESKYVYNPPKPPARAKEASGKTKPSKTEPNPVISLQNFLEFCAEKYKAQHYMLFILGHGIVVGNDLFLYDENTDGAHAVTLEDLGQQLRKFSQNVGNRKLDLVSFHSCSMSALEVAYELRDSANYMLASEGPAFVGSWPYKQILLRIFNDVKDHGDNVDVADTLGRIFSYCMYYSYDFQLAGYSFDLCLTDLNQLRGPSEPGIEAALVSLSDALSAGLKEAAAVADPELDPKALALANLPRELIVLSHLQAQSYYEENFTDLGDFCFCLKRRCENVAHLLGNELPRSINDIVRACNTVLRVLGCDKPAKNTESETNGTPGDETRNTASNKGALIVRSGFTGAAYQYSHGLSIYFPWIGPVNNKMWDEQYKKYKLSTDTGQAWRRFLETYFNMTRRHTQAKERNAARLHVTALNKDAQLLEHLGGLIHNDAGQLKSSPWDRTGGDCTCGSIKNYPRTTSDDDARRRTENEAVSVSPDILTRFQFFSGDR